MVKSRAQARSEKAATIDHLVAKLGAAEITVLTEYRGLHVAEMQDLRRRLRPLGVDYVVAKNTLARSAAEKTGRLLLLGDLVGPVALAFGNDPVALARSLQEFVRTNRLLVLKAALLGDRRLAPSEIEHLASLPPADQLRAQVFGGIVGPLSSAVLVLSAPLAGLVRVMNAKKEQMEESAGDGSGVGEANMASVDDIVQSLGDLKVLELAELVKQLEEKWGVSAAALAAPVAAAPAGGGAGAAAAPVEEQTEFDVVLKDFGSNKINVIKAVRELTSLGLKEAKDLVEAAPKPVLEGVAKDAAEAGASKLREAGATVDVA